MKQKKSVPKQKGQSLKDLFVIERKFDSIQDIDILLERILSEVRKIVNADAGSIYEVNNGMLRVLHAQNDTREKTLSPGEKLPYVSLSIPINEKSIAGYVAYKGEPLNIPDVYDISPSESYSYNKQMDEYSGYRTKSMYTIPLRLQDGKMIGVMQLINAKNKRGHVIAFSKTAELIVDHFAITVRHALQTAHQTNLMIQRMLKMSEMRDPKETYMHVTRVSEYASEIYDRYAYNHNVDELEKLNFIDCLRIAAKFHDIGKVGVSDTILKSTEVFGENSEARSILKSHTCIGAQLFFDSSSPLERMCYDVALHHHETWDGKRGYPGDVNCKEYVVGTILPDAKIVKGTEIPLAARVVSVADVFDALCCKRSYKEAWSVEDALAEIKKGSGSQFDPEVVDAFFQVEDRIRAIQKAYVDE